MCTEKYFFRAVCKRDKYTLSVFFLQFYTLCWEILSRSNLFCTLTVLHTAPKHVFPSDFILHFTLLHTALEKYFSGWIFFAFLHLYTLVRKTVFFCPILFSSFTHSSEKLFPYLNFVCCFTLLHTALEKYIFWDINSDRKKKNWLKKVFWSYIILHFYTQRRKRFFPLNSFWNFTLLHTALEKYFSVWIYSALLHTALKKYLSDSN